MVNQLFRKGRDFVDESNNPLDRNLLKPLNTLYLPKSNYSIGAIESLTRSLAGAESFFHIQENNSVEIYTRRINS